MNRLKLNTWTGILDIINCVLFALSWFVIAGTAFSDASNGGNATNSAAVFFYGMAWIGVILNVIALLQSRRHGISLVGPVLGIIGSALFGFTAAMAFPALVVLIVATVFTMLQHPSKSYVQSHNSNLNNQ
ncbi:MULTISPECIES: hypothetical protein [Lentilactobacillus]|nr:hypothetical protein [Lentilactobacillus farraginis]